uniref:Endonuclease/exonuclease/phosphatase domain-containing protein n=1 Tax=Cannabis sativa TaxID=3483 RepID=A0A803NYG3_CANSA
MKFRRVGGETFYANFKYERVPTFCFICGIMGHSERFCKKLYELPADRIDKPYSIEMKAPSERNFLVGVSMVRYAKAACWSGDVGEDACRGGRCLSTIQGSIQFSPPPIMNTLSWNCRGLGNPRAIQFLTDICVQKKPNFLFLCETLSKKDVMDRIKNKLGFDSCFVVEAQGRKGGLALLWKNSDDAHLLGYSDNHIDIEIHSSGSARWRLTGFYGEPNRTLRDRTWQLLKSIAPSSPLPWCIIGDFNNIASQDEKQGGRSYPSYLLTGFQDVIRHCCLFDLKLHGYAFTWERGRGTAHHVEIRLDKALVTQHWLDLFPNAILSNCDFSSSDHTPIFLQPEISSCVNQLKLFRYENAWSREPYCQQIVKSCWEEHANCTA